MTAHEIDQRQPIIGIAATSRIVDLRYVSVEAHMVFDPFVRRIVDAGGVPVLLPLLEPAAAGELVAAVDALLLTGGVDLHPDLYGGEPVAEPMGGPYDVRRDRFELALTDAARAAGTPVLGVCRGMHVLNVAAGGTLLDHVDAHLDQAARHEVVVQPASTLTAIVGSSVETGSLHHQAVDRVGAGLRVVATAPDGVVEAIEAADGGPVLGVQWHPELEPHTAGDPLWRWFVETAEAAR